YLKHTEKNRIEFSRDQTNHRCRWFQYEQWSKHLKTKLIFSCQHGRDMKMEVWIELQLSLIFVSSFVMAKLSTTKL
ncbi:hypothetical protein WUBG_17772, partial [Wuchereria bancrofti]